MRRFLLILFLAIAPIACHRKPSIPPDVVVRVSDRMVTLADFKRYLERNAGTDLAQMTPEVASALLDQYVEEIILSEYAASHGVEAPADKIASAVRNDPGSTVVEKRDQMRRAKLMAEVSTEIGMPDDAEVRTYYDTHPAEFRSGEEVHARQILVHDEALANDIVDKLRHGASFDDMSSQYSLAPNARKGGDIGYVSRGELPKMFEDEIFALKPGSVSGPIRTESSFHIFRVDDRRPPGIIDVQTAAPVIREKLRDDAIRQRVAQLVAKSRTEMQIAVLAKRLPFRYSGTLPKSDE